MYVTLLHTKKKYILGIEIKKNKLKTFIFLLCTAFFCTRENVKVCPFIYLPQYNFLYVAWRKVKLKILFCYFIWSINKPVKIEAALFKEIYFLFRKICYNFQQCWNLWTKLNLQFAEICSFCNCHLWFGKLVPEVLHN